MQYTSFVKPLLILTTVYHCIEIVIAVLGGLVSAYFFSITFQDDPSMPQRFPWFFALSSIAFIVVLPLGFTIAQWMLYNAKRIKVAVIVALVGMLPSVLIILRTMLTQSV